jgi:hypothetical protein
MLAARPYWVELSGSVRDSGSDTRHRQMLQKRAQCITLRQVCTKQEDRPGNNAAWAARAASPSAHEEQYSVEPVITCLG